MAVFGLGSWIRRVGMSVATVMTLVVLVSGCTDPGSWADTAPEPGGFDYYASGVIDSACATPEACVVVGQDAASVWNGTAWTETVVPAGITFGFVTCGAPELCVANPGRASDGTVAPVSRLDGTRWVPMDDPTGTVAGTTVTDASCSGPTFCMAAAARAGVGELVRWDGKEWSRTPVPTPPPTAGVLRVDCATPEDCLATASVGSEVQAYRWDGRQWSDAPKPPVNPSTLSCGAPSSCLVASDPVTSAPALVSWNGTAWSPAPMPPRGVKTLDCVSAEWCMAVTAPPEASPYVLQDGTWTAVPVPATVPAATLTSVACGAEDECLATGYRNEGGADHRAAVWWDGATWAGQPDLPRPTRAYGGFQSVSCPTDSWCMAAGFGKNGGAGFGPMAQVRQGAKRWVVTPVPAGGFQPDPLLDLSCASPSFCVIVGLGANPIVGQHDKALHWDGRAWRTVDLRPVLGSGKGPSKVSCPSATFCLATGGSTPLRFDGSAWQAVPGPGNANDVDCLSATQCRVTGKALLDGVLAATVNTWDGTAWVQQLLPAVEGQVPLGESISCVDAEHCIVASPTTMAAPFVLTWNGLLWTATPVATPNGLGIARAACGDAKRCVAVTSGGGRKPSSAALLTDDVATGSWAPTPAFPAAAGTVIETPGLACRPQYCIAVGTLTDNVIARAYAAVLYLGQPPASPSA